MELTSSIWNHVNFINKKNLFNDSFFSYLFLLIMLNCVCRSDKWAQNFICTSVFRIRCFCFITFNGRFTVVMTILNEILKVFSKNNHEINIAFKLFFIFISLWLFFMKLTKVMKANIEIWQKVFWLFSICLNVYLFFDNLFDVLSGSFIYGLLLVSY